MMSQPEIKLMCVSNVFVRQMHFKEVGDKEIGHYHPFDHTTLLSHGKIEVTVNNQKTIYDAPNLIFIKATEIHSIKALEKDTVVCCIHALRNGWDSEDIIDPTLIPNGVSLDTDVVPVFGVNKKWQHLIVEKNNEKHC
jgi:hypothetical protein